MLNLFKRKAAESVPDNASVVQPTARSASTTATKTGADKLGLFPDLNPQQLAVLYNALQQELLAPGSYLSQRGEAGGGAYLLLEGELESETGFIYPCLSWISVSDLASPVAPASLSLRANTQSRVMGLNADRFSLLPDTLQTYLLSRIAQSTLMQQTSLHERIQALQTQNDNLIQVALQARTHHTNEFVKSEFAQQVLNKVPRLPVSSAQLLQTLLDDDTTHAQVAELVSTDTALTGTLLKAINSATYNLQQKVADVSHAVSLLGFEAVYQIIMSESIRKSLPETPVFTALHQRSLELSHLAFVLAQHTGRARPAEMATLGLMAHIGVLVSELLCAQSPKLKTLFRMIEDSAMGSELLRVWNLPESLSQALLYRDYPEFALPNEIPEAVRDEVALLYLAEYARCLLRGETLQPAPVFVHEYMAEVGLTRVAPGQMFLERCVLPGLQRRRNALPQSLKACLP